MPAISPCVLPIPNRSGKATACSHEGGRCRLREDRRLPVIAVFLSLFAAVRVFFLTRTDIAIEVVALRQQVAVLKRKRPRPRLSPIDRFFWTLLRTSWSRWRDALVIVKPETVVGWHRAGFRLYWRWKSRPRGGRPKITPELRALIRCLAQENTQCGAHRRFMANCRSSALCCPSERSHAIYREASAAATQPRTGAR